MSDECYFCRGIVLVSESDQFKLTGHADHEIYVHERCAAGHDLLETTDDPDGVRITCPECGTVERK